MLIRKYEPSDTEKLIEIWYSASVSAHPFIPKEFWNSHKEELRNKYLPSAETWVAEENGTLVGFISLMGNYIGGLFVSPLRQGEGVGTKLIQQAKRERDSLNVGVYRKNTKALSFYNKSGFSYINEEIQSETGEMVINMQSP